MRKPKLKMRVPDKFRTGPSFDVRIKICPYCGTKNGGGRENCVRCNVPLEIKPFKKIDKSIAGPTRGEIIRIGAAVFLILFAIMALAQSLMAREYHVDYVCTAGAALLLASTTVIGIVEFLSGEDAMVEHESKIREFTTNHLAWLEMPIGVLISFLAAFFKGKKDNPD